MSLRRRWDYSRFLDEMHTRPDIDFQFVRPEHVTGASAQLPCRCKKCGYDWLARIVSIFTAKNGCLRCTGQIRWTLQRLLTEGAQRWPNVDFSRLREEDIKNSHTHITVGCKVCGDQRRTQINYLIAGYGCPTCSNNKRWTTERLFQEVVPLFQHKYDFSRIQVNDVCNQGSPFWITSYECGHTWQSSIGKLRMDAGCPTCCITAKWTWEGFLSVMQGRPDIDIRHVRQENVVNANSIITWMCSDNSCAHVWKTKLSSLVNGDTGCPRCNGHAPYTWERFTREFTGRTDVDLRLITREHELSCRKKLPFICTKCNLTFEAELGRVITYVSRCPRCNSSKGERAITNLLTQANIPFEREVVLASLPRKRFDFRFHYNNRAYLLEFDGEQHFTQNDFHHHDEAHFREKQVVDVVKSQHAYQNGYFLIRIDYTQIDNIREHLHRAMLSTGCYYLSNPEMYAYLFTTTVPSTITTQ